MGNFNSRAVLVLDRIYRFVGGKTLGRDFDTDTPIQPVHDLSRESEIGAGFGQSLGFWNWNQFRVAPGAETYRTGDDILTQLTWYTNADEANTWTWLMGTGLNISAAVHSQSQAVLYYPAFGGTLPGSPGTPYWSSKLLFASTGVVLVSNQDGSANTYQITPTAATEAQWPVFAPYGSKIMLRVVTTGAGNWNWGFLMWTGPKGVLPPGVA